MQRRRFLVGLAACAAPFQALAGPSRTLSVGSTDRDALLRTIWGEARGEPQRGQIAVAHVVFNRVLSDHPLFERDKTVRVACHRADQFSCWDRHHEMAELHTGSDEYHYFGAVTTYALWAYRHGEDYSRHATNYVRRSPDLPHWTREMRATVTIGKHLFMKPLKA